MSIWESIHLYNIGQLILQKPLRLKTGLRVLENKIDYMRQVAKQGTVAPLVYADIRKYEEVHKAIKEAILMQDQAESEMLCGLLKKVESEYPTEGRPDQLPFDYSII